MTFRRVAEGGLAERTTQIRGEDLIRYGEKAEQHPPLPAQP